MLKYEILFINSRGDEKYLRLITDKEDDDYVNRKTEKFILSNSDYKYSNTRKITCRGCIDNICNQEAHYGGCLYDPDLE